MFRHPAVPHVRRTRAPAGGGRRWSASGRGWTSREASRQGSRLSPRVGAGGRTRRERPSPPYGWGERLLRSPLGRGHHRPAGGAPPPPPAAPVPTPPAVGATVYESAGAHHPSGVNSRSTGRPRGAAASGVRGHRPGPAPARGAPAARPATPARRALEVVHGRHLVRLHGAARPAGGGLEAQPLLEPVQAGAVRPRQRRGEHVAVRAGGRGGAGGGALSGRWRHPPTRRAEQGGRGGGRRASPLARRRAVARSGWPAARPPDIRRRRRAGNKPRESRAKRFTGGLHAGYRSDFGRWRRQNRRDRRGRRAEVTGRGGRTGTGCPNWRK